MINYMTDQSQDQNPTATMSDNTLLGVYCLNDDFIILSKTLVARYEIPPYPYILSLMHTAQISQAITKDK